MDKQLSAPQKSFSINLLLQLTEVCVKNIKRIVVIFLGETFSECLECLKW